MEIGERREERKEERRRVMAIREMVKRIDRERIYTTGEIAELLGVAPTTVRFWIKKGWLDAVRIGGRYKIEGSALLEFIEKGQEGEGWK